MTTNGLAFTGEMVDFFNKYNFLIALSNDGPLSARSRGNNCLEDPYIVACYKALTNPYKRITSVLTAHNQDIFALWNYLYAKVGFGFYNLARQVLRVLPETPADLVEFDYKAFTAAYERLIALANDYISGGPGESPDEHLRYNSYKFMITISGGLERRVHALPKWGLDCGQFTTRLALDLTGNIYLCQNRGEVLGHVSGETADLYANYFQTGNAPNKYPQCVDCKVFPICQGQCPCIPWTPLKEKVCALLNIMYGPALFTFQPLAGVGDRRD
jgi:radical SAM protein with 4Fe4S-binding SPASM domain